MKQKGFTLIELLVVVAIIGILAAVGVVAYNGYTTAAKKSVAKTNQKNVVRWLAAEAQKCKLGAEKVLNDINERLSGRVVTKISLLKNYCAAEEYHQKYLEKR